MTHTPIASLPAPDDVEDDDPYCDCGAVHSIEEIDFCVCDCCGKILYEVKP